MAGSISVWRAFSRKVVDLRAYSFWSADRVSPITRCRTRGSLTHRTERP